MACKTCDELLAAYSREVRIFRTAVMNISGVLGEDDSRVTIQELDRLRQKCRNASEALMAHLRHDHGKNITDEMPGG